MKVNTFIVGAPKAGTTSLHYYLGNHAFKGEPLVNTRQHADAFEQKHKVRVYSWK